MASILKSTQPKPVFRAKSPQRKMNDSIKTTGTGVAGSIGKPPSSGTITSGTQIGRAVAKAPMTAPKTASAPSAPYMGLAKMPTVTGTGEGYTRKPMTPNQIKGANTVRGTSTAPKTLAPRTAIPKSTATAPMQKAMPMAKPTMAKKPTVAIGVAKKQMPTKSRGKAIGVMAKAVARPARMGATKATSMKMK